MDAPLIPFLLVIFITLTYLFVKNFKFMFMGYTRESRAEFWEGLSGVFSMFVLSFFLLSLPATHTYEILDNSTMIEQTIPLPEVQSFGYIFFMFSCIALVVTFLLNWRVFAGG